MSQQRVWWLGTLHFQNDRLSDPEAVDFISNHDFVHTLDRYAQYAVWQLERVSRLHMQVVVQLKERKRMTQVRDLACWPRRIFKPGHWEAVQDVPKAIEYCQKEESRVAGPFTHGEYRPKGKRTDIDEATELVRNGASDLEVIDAHPGTFTRYFRGLHAVRNALVAPLTIPRVVHLLYGPPNTGKSFAARFDPEFGVEGDPAKLFALPTGGAIWFDGLAGQPVALFDDFAGRASSATLTDVLKWTDKYPCKVPIKGGFATFTTPTLLITTNIHPAVWYEYVGRLDHYTALCRRFDFIHEFSISPNGVRSRRTYRLGTPEHSSFCARDAPVDPFPRPGLPLPRVELPNQIIDLSQD